MFEMKSKKLRRSASLTSDQVQDGEEDAQHLLGGGARQQKAFLHRISPKTYRTAAVVLFVCIIVAVFGDMTGLAPWRSFTFGGDRSNGSGSHPLDGPNTVPIVHTLNGSYAGSYSSSYEEDFFLGIPYAKPPLKSLRFRRPAPIDTNFDGVRDAKQFSHRCVGYNGDASVMSEDCLYLNVFRPSASSSGMGEQLPVMLWLHGGGFTMGGVDAKGTQFFNIIQHSMLIHKPFIVVSVNYRLSAWGFLAGNAIHSSGETNLGLRDQRLAIEWVKENIAAFGGDPKKVVIAGQSAGAFSVGYHLTAFGGRNDSLFRGGILQSGNPGNFGRIPTTGDLEPHFQSLLEAADCSTADDSVDCLRGLPFETLNNAIRTSNWDWRPSIDGDFIERQTSLQLQDGDFVHVPIMIGANTDEGTTFLRSKINTEASLVDLFRSKEPHMQDFEPLLEAYPDDPCVGIPESLGCTRPDPDSSLGAQYRRAAAFVGDFMFIANRRFTCQTWSQAALKAYCYRFDARRADVPATKGSGHSEEMPFVFDTVQESENKLLARLMGNSWASFISDLDPNSFRQSGDYAGSEIAKEGGRFWPSYSDEKPVNYLFKVKDCGPEDDTWRKEGIDIIIGNNAVDGR